MVASPHYPPLGAIPQGSPTLNVGSRACVWQPCDVSITRSNNTTAYSAGQLLGSPNFYFTGGGPLPIYTSVFQWTNIFRSPGSSALLTGLRFVMNAASIAITNAGSINAHLFQALPSQAQLSTFVDAAAFPTLWADDANKLGMLQISTWFRGGTGSDIIEAYAQPVLAVQPIIAAAGAQNLYCVMVAAGSITPIASAIMTAYVSTTGD